MFCKVTPRLRQSYVALGPILITISLGMAEGFSAILLPQLQKENQMKIDEELASWIASMAALPMAFGCILGGFLMEKIGRKTVHMLTCFPCIIGWLIIYFASNINMILAGRFLTGFCVGLLGPPTGVYMSETSEPHFRGVLLASISFAIAAGIFFAHLLGTFLSWQNTALLCCTFPVVCLGIMCFAPESPTFLIKMNKVTKADKAFKWCRGEAPEAQKEFNIILDRQKVLNSQSKLSFCEQIKELSKPEFVKPLIVICVFFTTSQWAGNNAITFYSVDIMQQTMGQGLDEYLSMLILDTIRLITSILACLVSKRMNRRPLAILSGTGTSISLIFLASFTFSRQYFPVLQEYSFVPLTALVGFVTFITIGFVPLPWTMMGEVFPLSSRGMGSGISSLVNYLMVFLVVKTSPAMFLNIGPEGSFLVYGLLSLAGTGYLWFFLPETRDKPLHEIEDRFKNCN